MNKIAFGTGILVALLVALSLLPRNPPAVTTSAGSANDVAFRDGAYLGQLAAVRGESPRIASGRWSTVADRRSFVLGYEEGYSMHMADASERGARATDGAYRDGLYQGRLDAEQFRPVHVTSGRWSRPEDRSSFSDGYKEAYATVSSVREDYDQTVREALLKR